MNWQLHKGHNERRTSSDQAFASHGILLHPPPLLSSFFPKNPFFFDFTNKLTLFWFSLLHLSSLCLTFRRSFEANSRAETRTSHLARHLIIHYFFSHHCDNVSGDDEKAFFFPFLSSPCCLKRTIDWFAWTRFDRIPFSDPLRIIVHKLSINKWVDDGVADGEEIESRWDCLIEFHVRINVYMVP